MKQIQCSEIEEKLLQGMALSDEEMLHLLGCRECQRFSGVCQMLSGDKGPSPETDQKVLEAVSLQLDARRAKTISVRPMMRFFRIIGMAAAMLLVVFLVTRSIPKSSTRIAVAKPSRHQTVPQTVPTMVASKTSMKTQDAQQPAGALVQEKTVAHEAVLLFHEDTIESLDNLEYELLAYF